MRGMDIKRGMLLGTSAVAALLAVPALADEQTGNESPAELQARLDALKARLAALEDAQDQQGTVAVEKVAPAQAVTGGAFPGSWKLPGSDTSLSFSGYVKADAFFTMNAPSTAIGDSFVLSNIPIKGTAANSQGGDFRMHSKQSRIRFESRTPTDWGNFSTRIEGDFFTSTGNQRVSNSDTFRIRQAYGTLGPVLAGQTQSTFMDEDTFAEMIDNYGPSGDTNIRQTQIRYTADLAPGMFLDGALENPEATIQSQAGNGVTGNLNAQNIDKMPDIIARFRYKASWGAVNVSGVARYFTYNQGNFADDSTFGGGFHGGVTLKTWGKDKLMGTFNYGPGIGRYIRTAAAGNTDTYVTCAGGSNATLTPACGPDLQVTTMMGGWASYQHWWLDNLRSNVVYGWFHSDVPVGSLGAGANGFNENIQNASVNLIWNPVSKVAIGLEYMYGWRYLAKAATTGGQMEGNASRLQLGMQYFF